MITKINPKTRSFTRWSQRKCRPQESVLGPLLFVLYINELPDQLECLSLVFADDTKIFRAIKSTDDITALQRDLMKLEEWSQTWLLKFHADKCKVLTFSLLEKIEMPRAFLYELHGIVLEHVFEEKDLGVHVDGQLCFDAHIDDKISKANSLLGLIRGSFTCLSPDIMLSLHRGLVCNHLEYGGVLWNARASRAQL